MDAPSGLAGPEQEGLPGMDAHYFQRPASSPRYYLTAVTCRPRGDHFLKSQDQIQGGGRLKSQDRKI
jgi:hypothetical protein